MMCKVLIFGCIAAVMLMTAAYGAALPIELQPTQKEELLKASIMDLAQLKNFKNNDLDFYTPNATQECNQTALECYLRELEVLKQAVGEEDKRRIINIQKNLEDFKAGYSPDPKCKTCESNDKKTFPGFRQELERFLQYMLIETV